MKKLIGDLKHILWLTSVCEEQWCLFDYSEAAEAIFWIKIHVSYKSKKVK